MPRWTWYFEHGDWAAGLRLRSWALPLLVTWTPTLFEIAVGPFFWPAKHHKNFHFERKHHDKPSI